MKKKISKVFHAIIQCLLVDNFSQQLNRLKFKSMRYVQYHAQEGFSLVSDPWGIVLFSELHTVPHMEIEGILYAITAVDVDAFGGVTCSGQPFNGGLPKLGILLTQLSTEVLCNIADRIRLGKISRI